MSWDGFFFSAAGLAAAPGTPGGDPAAETWVARYNRTTRRNDSAGASAIDAAGNVHAAGRSNYYGGDSDLITLKYDPRGNLLWAAGYNGTGGGADTASALAVDGSGNVSVAGASVGQGPGADFVTIRYRQVDAAGEGARSGEDGGCFISTVLP